METGAEKVSWNLDDLYASPADGLIDADMAALEREVEAFSSRWRGTVAGLAAREMEELLRGYEALAERTGRASSFAQLSWTAKTDEPARGALLQKQTETGRETSRFCVNSELLRMEPTLRQM